MQTHIWAPFGAPLKSYTIIYILLTRQGKAVPQIARGVEMGDFILIKVLLITRLHKDIGQRGDFGIGTAHHCEVLEQLVDGMGVVHQIQIDAEMLVVHLVAQGDVVHKRALLALEHIEGIEGLEMPEVARPE